jgi:hypothetical protein
LNLKLFTISNLSDSSVVQSESISNPSCIVPISNYFKVVEQNIKRDCKKRHEQVEQELNEMIDKQKNVHDELKTLQLSCTSLQSYRSTTTVIL